MTGRFHDEDYDGIVLKIPSFFINMNGLEVDIQSLFERLDSCNLSQYHPDHLNNLKELEYYKTKTDSIKEKKRMREESSAKRAEWQKKCIAEEVYDLEWVNEKCLIDMNNGALEINGVQYDHEKIFTKHAVSSTFEKEFKTHCCNSLKTLTDFLQKHSYNATELINNLIGLTDETFDMSSLSLFYSNKGWYQLGVSYQVLNVKHDYSVGTVNLNCRRSKLLTFKDGCYAICMWHGWHNAKRLEGFTKNQLTLIKK